MKPFPISEVLSNEWHLQNESEYPEYRHESNKYAITVKGYNIILIAFFTGNMCYANKDSQFEALMALSIASRAPQQVLDREIEI